MATPDQLDNAEAWVRSVFPGDLAWMVIADDQGTNPFGALAHKLSRATLTQQDPYELLEEFLERANDPDDREVAPVEVILGFDSPAAYVASRIKF